MQIGRQRQHQYKWRPRDCEFSGAVRPLRRIRSFCRKSRLLGRARAASSRGRGGRLRDCDSRRTSSLGGRMRSAFGRRADDEPRILWRQSEGFRCLRHSDPGFSVAFTVWSPSYRLTTTAAPAMAHSAWAGTLGRCPRHIGGADVLEEDRRESGPCV